MKELKNKKVSQLDFLWANFGGLSVSGGTTNSPDTNILTERAILGLLNANLGSALVSLDCKVNTYNSSFYDIIGTTLSGASSTLFSVPINSKITKLEFSNGALIVENENGNRYAVEITGLESISSASNSNSISHTVEDGTLISSLNVSDDSYIRLVIEEKGLAAYIPVTDVDNNYLKDVRIVECSLAEYSKLPFVDSGTFYYLTDKLYFYFNNQQYGHDIVQDPETGIFTIDGKEVKAEDSDLYWINI